MLFPRQYSDALRSFCAADAASRSRFLDRVGVRVQVLTRSPLGLFESSSPVDDVPGVIAYKSSSAFNRCSVVPAYQVEADPHQAASALFREDLDANALVLLEKDTAPAGNPGTSDRASSRIVVDGANTVQIDAECPADSTLVLYDTYDPGWHAEVDGKPAEIVRAFGLFRAVRLQPGQHSVRFSYVPDGVVAGGVVTLATMVALIGFAVVYGRNRVRLKSTGSTQASG